ncbi:unnamed protein product [Parnassius apollo]|uniref:(apollo) hypothetical protein n=1 Tax=Parnassius apollo TaxID=110799 RepID=A0A8S3X1A1_PARAO|nr:unnamed protein product [Parnassius apollo]
MLVVRGEVGLAVGILCFSCVQADRVTTRARGSSSYNYGKICDKMRHYRCSKIISMVRSTSSSQESNLNTNYYELPLSTTNENNSLNNADLHNSSDSILDFDSDDSFFDKNYLPSSLDQSKCSEDPDSSTNTTPQSPSINVTVPESPEVSSDEDTPQNFTKKGTIRKRKKYDESPAQRKQIKKLKDMESKYKLKPGGTHIIYYKTAFHNEEEYSLEFLRLKNIKSGIPPPKPKNQYRGISQERKTAIIQKLTPLMPDNRKSFWYNLPTDKNSVDLTQVDED